MTQFRSAFLSSVQMSSAQTFSAQTTTQVRLPTSKLKSIREPVGINLNLFDVGAAAAVARFGRAWIHFSRCSNR